MGLCFETLNKDKMASEAYRQAWNALLEQRAARQTSTGNGGAFEDGAAGVAESSGKGMEEADRSSDNGDDEIGRILQQAKMALTIGGSISNRGTSGWSRDGTPQQKQRGEGTPEMQAAGRSLGNLERRGHCRSGITGTDIL